MESVKAMLTHKVGPLPAIAWGGILGGIYVGYAYYKRRQSAATDGSTPIQANPDLGTATDFTNGLTDATDGGTGGGSSATLVSPGAVVPDNTTWGRRAINYLIALGMSAADASHAVTSYIYGTGFTLNSSQAAALQEAILRFGVPPDGPLDFPDVADPTPAQPIVTNPTPAPVVAAPTPNPVSVAPVITGPARATAPAVRIPATPTPAPTTTEPLQGIWGPAKVGGG